MYDTLEGSGPRPWWKEKKTLFAIAALVVLIVAMIVVAVVVIQSEKHTDNNEPQEYIPTLHDRMQIDRLMHHLKELETIAADNGGSRTAQTGYNDSVAYIMRTLNEHTQYNVYMQEFSFPFYTELVQPRLSQVSPDHAQYSYANQFRGLRFCGSGDINGTVHYVNGGCQDSDYNGFPLNGIALIERNGITDCSVQQKIDVAISHHVAGVLMANDPGSVGLFTRGLNGLVAFPAFSITASFATDLKEVLSDTEIVFNMISSTEAPMAPTMNVIAETVTGDPSNVILIGSHLDSVPAGPGINDNGSGSSANLELAIQLSEANFELKNRVRFVWFAAEEFGLVGSYQYVSLLNQTNPQELKDIALNLNFDMLGSPNFFRGIYNGSGAADNIRFGSEQIQELFVEYFVENNLPYDMTPFTGRSDYGPFIEIGIPAGGLFTGAEVVKDANERARYGGFANTAYDPCYHLACDTVDNVNQEVLLQMAQAAAWSLDQLVHTDNLRAWLTAPQ